mgnify:CR=1 FL=1
MKDPKFMTEIQEALKTALKNARQNEGMQFFPPSVYAGLREQLPDFTPEWWADLEPWCCPACWQGIPSTERQGEYPGALSRRGDYYVCSDCGTREGLEDYAEARSNGL